MRGYEAWFLRLIEKLFENDQGTLKLLKDSPFHNRGPTFIRALFYHYRYTDWSERSQTSAWWVRQLLDVYLPAVSVADLRQLSVRAMAR